MLTPLLVFLCACAGDVTTSKSSDILNSEQYLVVYANSLIPGVPLDVRVTILTVPSDVKVSVSLLEIDSRGHIVIASSVKSMVPGETNHIQLQVPSELEPSDNYFVEVAMSGGLNLSTLKQIKLERDAISIITQMDKTRYSGGQDVKFRSVLLLPNLLGYKGNASVTVYDGQSNKLQVFGPRPTDDGVIEGMFTLSKEPVFGDWRLVTTTQATKATKTFTVKPYVLPKFSVSIAIISQNSTDIEVNVTARYTFNSEVHGTCKVQIYESSHAGAVPLEYQKEIQGSVVFHIRTSAIRGRFSFYHHDISIRALVTDSASAVTMVAEKYNFVPSTYAKDADKFRVERFDNRYTFFPGMNFYTTLMVKKNDEIYHTPVNIGVNVKLTTLELKSCLLAHPPYDWLEEIRTTLPMINVQTDATGMAALNISTPYNARFLYIEVTSEVTTGSEEFPVYPLVWGHPPMLRLIPSKPHVQVGEDIVLAVNASEGMTGKLTVEVYARGMALSLTSVDIGSAGSRSASVTVTATEDMVPHCHVVVSHVTVNNSFMHDYALVKVLGSPTKNQVSVGYNTSSLEPGQGLELTVTADPNSTVYVLAEDQRNRLLGTANDVFLYQLDDVVSEAGYNILSDGKHRGTGSKRSIQLGPLATPMPDYLTGYSFMEDGVVVLPEAHNILGHVQYFEIEKLIGYTNYSSHLTTVTTTSTTTPYPTTTTSMGWPTSTWAMPSLVPMATPTAGPSLGPNETPTAMPSLGPNGTPTAGPSLGPNETPTSGPGLGLTTASPIHVPAPVLRNYFPETWIWEKFNVGPSGKLSLPVTVPDSITSWVTSVFATNEKTGFGIASTKPKVTVKKEFFVTMSPPKLIVLGEEFLLQLTVYNYLDTAQKVLVQVNTTDDPSKVMESTFNVNPGDGHSTFFQITPANIGEMKITALARAGFFANIAVDELVKTVNVKPPGVHKTSNEQHMVDVSSSASSSASSFNNRFALTDPPNMVTGSKSIKMTITGDFMTNTVEGLENLIHMPFGCGEQTMLNFAPDIYVTKYLKTVGKMTEKIRQKTMTILKSGLQRELTYKHRDGSFSAFGDRDTHGSSWLTAFVLKCFQQADGILDIDESIKSTGVNWLLRYQNSDGSFYEPGRIIHTQMQAGTGRGFKLTAFILISILENSNHAKSSSLTYAVSRASTYLERNLEHVTDMYSLAIVCYALARAGKPDCFHKLQTAAVHDGDKMYWTANTVIHQTVGPTKSTRRALATRALSADIEATSYCLLTYLVVGERLAAKPVVKWLVSQRNPTGGFRSTQDTVISLQALSVYASSHSLASQVDFSASGGAFAHAYSVSKANEDILHVVEVPASLSELIISATGSGNAVVDVTMSFYVGGVEDNNQIAVNATIVKESLNSISVLTCVQWNGAEASGMLVAEVEMPTGFSYDTDALDREPKVKKHELLGQNVALYFDGVSAGAQVCPTVKMDRTDPVVKSQACHVTAYDYYEPTNQARTRFESGVLKSSTICDVCPECSFCKGGGGIGVTRFHLDAELASAMFQKFLDKRQEAAVYIIGVGK